MSISNTGLNKTLAAIGRSSDSEIFYRDTPELLRVLDNLEKINRDLKTLSKLYLFKKQAD